jgi:hypothetical protein
MYNIDILQDKGQERKILGIYGLSKKDLYKAHTIPCISKLFFCCPFTDKEICEDIAQALSSAQVPLKGYFNFHQRSSFNTI